MKYLETGSRDPYYNLAFEEVVLLNRKDDDYLILWQNDNTIVIGQNQNTEAEINRAFVDEHHITVARRATGGGAVYHDRGNLNYSFISDYEGIDHVSLAKFAGPVVAALRELGLEAETSGRNDILVDGKKVSGTAQRISGGRILYHGCLLFDTDPDMVAGALKVDPEKFRYKGTKSVRSRVGTIRSFLPKDMDMAEFWSYLRRSITGSCAEPETLTPEELRQAETLRNEKYSTWEWNFGRSYACAIRNKARFPGGTVEVGLELENGVIGAVHFSGDFLSMRPLDDPEQALRGCRYEESSVKAALAPFELREYFGAVTPDELLNLLFRRT